MNTNTKFKQKDFISIGTPVNSEDYKLFRSIVNVGIDSHLEAFVKSQFFFDCGKFYFHFHKSERKILLRRLNDVLDNKGHNNTEKIEYYETWIDDITNYEKLVSES